MLPRAESRTRTLARILGPFLVVLSVSVLLRAGDLQPILSEFAASAVWPWATGVYVTAAGIAVVAFHRSWRGAAAVLVSLLGWLTMVKGILLLTFPSALDSLASRMVSATALMWVVYAILMVVSLYLTYVGWRPEREDELHRASRADGDVPRATT